MRNLFEHNRTEYEKFAFMLAEGGKAALVHPVIETCSREVVCRNYKSC